MCSGENPVDGLFVSVPNDGVVPAINECKLAGIPIIAVNSGSVQADNLDLQEYVGQLESTTGFDAGEKMVAAGAKRLFCLNHNPGVTSLTQRCDGFKTAVSKSGTAQFVAEVDVNATNQGEYIAAVEAAVGESGAWTGVGIILTGSIQAPLALGLQLLAAHSNALIATFDTGQVIFNALQSGEYLFAINQQPYFQGYLPIPLLTAKIQANRQLLNFFLH